MLWSTQQFSSTLARWYHAQLPRKEGPAGNRGIRHIPCSLAAQASKPAAAPRGKLLISLLLWRILQQSISLSETEKKP